MLKNTSGERSFRRNRSQNHSGTSIMRLNTQCLRLTLSVIAVASVAPATVAQQQLPHVPPTQVTIDEDILAAFVDEPCHHFEAARDRFLTGDSKQASEHLRTAAAFLRLDAARAAPDGKAALRASIAELGRLAGAVEDGRIDTVQVLQQAFARAHYALAGHHCVKSAHRCCRPATFQDKQESARAGRDLKAATVHLNKGAWWSGGELDEQTQELLERAQLTADHLIRQRGSSRNEVDRNIRALHGKLEEFSGLKIMLAPPLSEDRHLAPSILR